MHYLNSVQLYFIVSNPYLTPYLYVVLSLQSPPNHVIPCPEEIYIYSPLGTAFKVTGSEHGSKNPSIITM